MNISKSMKKTAKLTLGLALGLGVIQIPTVQAADSAWQLSDAALESSENNDVFLTFGSGQKARITLLNEDVFRIDVEQQGEEFKEYPEPMSSTHTTKITAKSEADYEKEGVITAAATDAGDKITVSGGNIILTVDKASAKMKLENKEGKLLWEESESLSYNGTETVQSLATGANEYFYGGGQQNGFFSHKNRKILIENKSTWVSGGVSSPNPFYMSSNGYGVMRNTFQPGSYDFNQTAKLEHDENRFDAYYFVGNDMKDVLGDYVELTGNPMLMPKYAFYQGNANCYNSEGESLIVDGIARAKEYQDHDMPVGWFLPNDGYGCGYGKSTNADENIAELKNFVDEAKKYGFVSGLWTENDLDKLDREVANGGTQMIKTDVAWVGDGYSFGLNAVRQAFEGIENNSENPGFVVSLDGWAGTQRYAGLWSGDQTGGNWEYIRFHIPTYIGAGLSGNPNVGSDLDGIYGSDKIISTRDFQWKAFTPIEINMDGWTSGAEKNPWYHGEPYTSINRMYLKMKSSFMPYTYTYAKEAHDTGTPMIRGLVLEYPQDPFTWGNRTQYEYMWGENLLVAPLYEDVHMDENGNDVRNNIYLPDQDQIWIDYFTGKQYQGGQVINNFEAPLWKLPLFVKNGAILSKDVENNSQLYLKGDEDRIFEVYPAGNTEFNLYDDDGMTQKYKEGQGTNTLITSKAPEAGATGDATITVNKMTGSYDGMKTERGTQFIVNVSDKPSAVTLTVGGNPVTLTEVTNEADFEAGSDVYFYQKEPNLNHYASEGSSFEEVTMKTTPKLLVKTAKTDITQNAVELTLKDFVNAAADDTNPDDPALTDVPTLSAEADDSSITLSWDMTEGISYGLIIDGNEDVIYRNMKSPYVHDSLNSGESHTYQLVVYNTLNADVKGNVQRFETKEDRYKNVIKDVSVTTNSQYGGNVGGYPAVNAVDGDESTLWYTNWEDPETYSGTKILTIDLKEAYQLDQFEYFNNGSAQIKNHEIQVSLDGTHFKTVEKSTWERKGETRVFVDLKGVKGRYVRLLSYDPHHNSTNEIRIYKVNKTEGFHPASTQGNKEIEDGDITFLTNYMGVTAAEAGGGWNHREPGDFNYNNEIDAYDMAFVLSQYGLKNTGKKAGGSISYELDKSELKAGESATLTLNGKNLKDLYAFGTRFTLGKDVIEKLNIKCEAGEAVKDMINMSKFQQDSADYVTAMSYKGAADGVQGDALLATITLTAKEDVTLNVENFMPFVVSTGLDVRLAIAGENEPANVAQLENVLAAAQLDTSAYTYESTARYEKAISDAQKLLDRSDATQEEMNQAMAEILSSLNEMERKPLNRMAALKTLVELLSEEAPKADYNQSDLDKILATITNAEAVAGNPDASEAEIDEAIQAVADRLMATKDKNGTDAASHELYQKYAAALLANHENDFSAATMEQLEAALDAYEKDTALIDELTNAVLNLAPVAVVDKNVLQTVVDITDAIGLDDYADTAEIKATLNDAKTLLAQADASQAAIDEKVTELTTAMTAMLGQKEASAIEEALIKLVEEAKALDITNKTDASKKAFEEALANAEAVLADTERTDEMMEAAYEQLAAAIHGLVDKVETDKDALRKAIEKAEAIDLSLYTKASADRLTAALKAAKLIEADQSAEQETVDEAAEALNEAIEALVKLSDDQTDPDDDNDGDNNGNNNGDNDGDNDDNNNGYIPPVKPNPSNPIKPNRPITPEITPDSGNGVNTGDATNTASLVMLMTLAGGTIVWLRKKSKVEA